MMRCEDVELELSSTQCSAEAQAHLAQCRQCQETQQLLNLAAMPPLPVFEEQALETMAKQAALMHSVPALRPSKGRQWASLAAAAGIGALLATGAMRQFDRQPEPQVQTQWVAMPEFASLDSNEDFDLENDEVFFNVGWPSPTDGEI